MRTEEHMLEPAAHLTIRRMTREEMDIAVDWAAKEGWNPGIHDAESFYRADPDGFFAGVLDDDEIVATLSIVRYSGDLCFGGFLIVRRDLRGRGIGKKMIDFMMDRSADCNLGGDGVPAMLPTYEKNGFKFAYWNHRFQGWGGGDMPSCLTPISELSYDDVERYDRSIFPAPRDRFLRNFLHQEDSTSLASVKDDEIIGYGVIRKCHAGHKIGPLFAKDRRTAEKIARGLISTVPGEQFFLDVPEPNIEGIIMANDFRMREVFTTACVYTKYIPKVPLENVFGVTSFELG